jgi:energy-coupling factor transporter transmembrane protein EcfT
MESRAWGATKNRTNLYVLRLHAGDFVLALITVAIFVIAVYVRLYVAIPSLNEFFGGFF